MKAKIIDFHTHPYPGQAENSCMYRESLALSSGEAKADMELAGIDHICGSVIAPSAPYRKEEGFAPLRRLNEKALQMSDLYGSYYTPGFHVHPAFVEESLQVLEGMKHRHFRLIGELVPYMHGWAELGMTYASPEFGTILNKAGEYKMAVSYHTMNEWQDEMEAMIAGHPDVTFVAAHPGQKEDFLNHLERLKKYKNAYLDLSGTGLFRYGMLKYGIEQAGAEKFLFGTDYPITNPKMYVEAVKFEHISDRDREMIFCKNAERILGM